MYEEEILYNVVVFDKIGHDIWYDMICRAVLEYVVSLYGRSLHHHSSIYPSIFPLLIFMDFHHSLPHKHFLHHPHHSPLSLDFRYFHQAVRTRTSDEFRSAKRGIMFSSDVTARGLDYPDVTLVLQVSVLCRAMLRCAVLCCAVLCCAVLCCAVLCCAVLCALTGLAAVICMSVFRAMCAWKEERERERENQTRKDGVVSDLFLPQTPILLSHSLQLHNLLAYFYLHTCLCVCVCVCVFSLLDGHDNEGSVRTQTGPYSKGWQGGQRTTALCTIRSIRYAAFCISTIYPSIYLFIYLSTIYCFVMVHSVPLSYLLCSP